MGKVISICSRRFEDEPESTIEVFRLVLALIWNMRGIVNNHVKRVVLERHVAVIRNNVWMKLGINVQTHDLPFAALPESPNIYGCIENRLGPLSWVKVEHHFQKLRIGSKPNRWQR